MTDTEPGPITKEELQKRGMDDALFDLVEKLVLAGSRERFYGRYRISRDEMWVFGFGPSCECGERGLEPGEETCKLCPSEDDDELEETETA